ncbi:hypothetical protein Tco_1520174, partial [Tanacetum coccineum]
LTKSAKSEGFEQIVDFLNASSIKYALTVNPTIYISCIEQFWSTVKAKTVNEEVQLQALVDGKKIVVTKASVRKDLQLEDIDSVDCLPNAIIFEQFTLMGKQRPRKPKRKDTKIPQSSVPVKNVANKAVYEERDGSLERATTTSGLDAEQDRDITLENVHDANMFGVHDLDGDEVFVETKEPVVNAAKDLSDVDMTLAQALAELKSTKPKVVTTVATTTTTAVTRPKAKGLVIQEQD